MRYLLTLAALLVAFPAFAQEPVGKATATVVWTIPSAREDGTPLRVEELAGYTLYYGQQSRFLDGGDQLRPSCGAYPVGPDDITCYSTAMQIPDGSQTSMAVTFTVTEPTALWFSIIARDFEGRLSRYSDEVVKTFDLIVDTPPQPPTITEVQITVTCTTGAEPALTCRFDVN